MHQPIHKTNRPHHVDDAIKAGHKVADILLSQPRRDRVEGLHALLEPYTKRLRIALERGDIIVIEHDLTEMAIVAIRANETLPLFNGGMDRMILF